MGVRKCVSRLKQVVLPAPFGPISAWIVPRRTRRLTSLTATKPLNSLVSCRVSRIVSSAMPRRRAHGAPSPLPPVVGRLWATPDGMAMLRCWRTCAARRDAATSDGLTPVASRGARLLEERIDALGRVGARAGCSAMASPASVVGVARARARSARRTRACPARRPRAASCHDRPGEARDRGVELGRRRRRG